MDSTLSPIINGEIDKKFLQWINSINKGFSTQIRYDRFEKYCKQAESWLQDKLVNFENDSRDVIVECMTRERDRLDRNSLYYFSRYCVIKDGDAPDGFLRPDKRKTFRAQKVLAYIFDSGLSFILGKPRQMGCTLFILPMAMKRTLVKEGYLGKIPFARAMKRR